MTTVNQERILEEIKAVTADVVERVKRELGTIGIEYKIKQSEFVTCEMFVEISQSKEDACTRITIRAKSEFSYRSPLEYKLDGIRVSFYDAENHQKSLKVLKKSNRVSDNTIKLIVAAHTGEVSLSKAYSTERANLDLVNVEMDRQLKSIGRSYYGPCGSMYAHVSIYNNSTADRKQVVVAGEVPVNLVAGGESHLPPKAKVEFANELDYQEGIDLYRRLWDRIQKLNKEREEAQK